jgi:long-subunit fatty acid transport protein
VRSAGLAAAVMVTMTAAAAAQDVSLARVGSGARAAGMGNAFVAVSDDGTAASWNPAGLSQLVKPEFSLVHSTSRRGHTFEGFLTRDQSSAFTSVTTWDPTADIEFASAAVPFRLAGKPVTLQASWRRLYQLATRLRGDFQRVPVSPSGRPGSALRLDATTDGSIHLWTFAGAVRATDRLSLGWSLDFTGGEWEDWASASEDPGILGPTDLMSSVHTARVSGHTLSLGLLLAYPSVSVGAVYHGEMRGGFTQTLSSRSSLTEGVESASAPGGQMRFPRSFAVGVAWRARPLLRLALDATYDEWTRFLVDETPESPEGAVNAFDGLPAELSAARNTVSVNAGMEKLFPVKAAYVPLRLGVAYEPQGARDFFLREDSTFFGLAAGTGWNTNSLKLDFSLEYRWGVYRGSEDMSVVYQVGRAEEFGLPPSPEAQGTERHQEWRLKVSVIYRVTNTEKLGGFLKKIFGS